jgi:23S rRNA (adenine2030-N6)-methyltransferase
LQDYQHSRHAGNFADVIKHIILVEILSVVSQQNKPYVYIDTHAGAGLYQPTIEPQSEYMAGVGSLLLRQPSELKNYFTVLEQYNSGSPTQNYPGSPLIALSQLRPGDAACLFEQNAEVFEMLRNRLADEMRVELRCEDGYAGLLSLLPSITEKCFVLIDPVYKDVGDYELAPQTLRHAYDQKPDGIYAIWYPVIERVRVFEMEKLLAAANIKNIQQYELNVKSDCDMEMTGAGMFVVNPPTRLRARMQTILPMLAEILAQDEGASFRCKVLTKSV